jgi:TPP-dependent pyruvate/acetoin dehydrogenase alpha subunit
MVLSRVIEDRLHAMFKQGRLRGRLVSGRGQEAIPVGAAAATDERDVICPVHRDLGAHLVRGTTPEEVLLHYVGRSGSPSNGRDGDIHMGVWHRGVFPMISHLPDSWPIALGLGLARMWDRSGGVVVAFCGDGATSTGAWHETMNAAGVWQTPTVFVVENNQYAYSTPTARQYAVASIADRASAYGMPGEVVDGNDVEAVHASVSEAVARARAGGGPSLIEAVTMRMDGHAVHDPADYVPVELLDQWRARDPIELQQRRLIERDGLAAAVIDDLWRDAQRHVEEAVAAALAAPDIDAASICEGVFANAPVPPRTRSGLDPAVHGITSGALDNR